MSLYCSMPSCHQVGVVAKSVRRVGWGMALLAPSSVLQSVYCYWHVDIHTDNGSEGGGSGEEEGGGEGEEKEEEEEEEEEEEAELV